MGGLSLLLCFLLPFTIFSQKLPALPQSFSVMVESNYLEGQEANSTTYSFGYYDYAHNRFRIEEHTQNAAIVYIVLPDQHLSYTLVVGTSNCTTKDNTNDVSLIAGEFFIFAQNTSVLNYTYVGNGNARGIITDVWNATYVGPDPTFKDSLYSNFTIMYQFSVDNWQIRAGDSLDYRVPVKATMEGFTTLSNYVQVSLSRQYNFMDFFYGTFDDTLFAQPLACIPKPPSYSKSEAFTAGGIAGVVVAGAIILGAVVGRVIYLRRNPVSGRGHRLADDAVM